MYLEEPGKSSLKILSIENDRLGLCVCSLSAILIDSLIKRNNQCKAQLKVPFASQFWLCSCLLSQIWNRVVNGDLHVGILISCPLSKYLTCRHVFIAAFWTIYLTILLMSYSLDPINSCHQQLFYCYSNSMSWNCSF